MQYSPYSSFAQVYDTFMDNIPYQEWADYVVSLLREYGIEDGLMAELGCGTGNMTALLAKAGYDMIGIDSSEDMLAEAIEKREKQGLSILYLFQDMRELELYGTVRAAVSVCDSMNYLLEEQELLEVFTQVNNYLDENGIFIFDLNTKYKYETILGDRTFAENREDCSFIWDNYYDPEEGVNEYALTIYVKDPERQGSHFLRFDEMHYQRAYSLETIKALLRQAGMEFLAAYDAFTIDPVQEDSERIYVLAREGRQEGKLYLTDC